MSESSPSVSIVIPAHNEEAFIGRCLDSIADSARHADTAVEVVVVLNRCTDQTRDIAQAKGARCVVEDRRCLAAIRNAGVRASTGEVVMTIDADSWMTNETIGEALRHLSNPRTIGGGSVIVPERLSVGIVFSLLAIAPYVLRHRVSGGLFWLRRETFDTLEGFDEALVSLEDLDFALRLKALGKARGQRFRTLRRGRIMTSCRKFDTFGDWYLFKNPRLVRRIFSGRDRAAADHFYYDTER